MSSGRRRRRRWSRSAAKSRRPKPTKREKRSRIVRHFERATREVQDCPSVAYLDATTSNILPNGAFGKLRVTAILHSGLFVSVELDVADRPLNPLPQAAHKLYLRKSVYAVWEGSRRVVAFHCDGRHKYENPTHPHHRHRHLGGNNPEPLEAGDPRTLTEFLSLVVRQHH